MSTLTAYSEIAERSEATPGLFNRILSTLSSNIRTAAEGPFTSSSSNTFSISTNLLVSGGGQFQFLSVGSTPPSEVTTAAIIVAVNSASSDYLYLTDSSGARSNYVIGSRAGGTADGLNIWDASGDTMIASFSKQSVRFWQPAIGPLVDTSGNVFNVRGYGALGAGANETAAFLGTANAAGFGGHIVVPPGLYGISGLTLAYANQEWELASGATLRLSNSSNTPIVTITGTGVVFRGGALDGNKANNITGPRADGIRVVSTGSIRILNVVISDCTTDGVRFETVSNSEIVGCQIRNCGGLGIELVSACSDVGISGCQALINDGTTTSTGIQIDGRNSPVAGKYTADSNYRIHVINCFASGHSNAGIFYNGSFDGSIVGCSAERNRDMGIDLEFADRITITGCSTRSNGNFGIASFQSNENCAIVGNVCYGDGTGIVSQVTCVGIAIVGNVVSSCTSFGIYLNDTTNALVSGNVSRKNKLQGIELFRVSQCAVAGNQTELNDGEGIRLNNTVVDCTISGNACRNNGRAFTGSGGIGLVGGNCVRNIITGNVCTDSQASKTQAYGIELRDSTDTNNTIIGNVVANNFLASLQLASLSNEISHNFGPADTAIHSVGTDGTTLLPALTFVSERSLGFYRSGSSHIGMSYGGFAQPDGSALIPPYTFSSESSLGLFRSGTSTLNISYGTMKLGTGAVPVASLPGVQLADGGSQFFSATDGTRTIIMGANGTAQAIFGTLSNHPVVIRTNNNDRLEIGSGGTISLKQNRLLSLRTNAANSGLFTTLDADEISIGIGVSNATIMFRSGNTAFVWGTSSTTTGA